MPRVALEGEISQGPGRQASSPGTETADLQRYGYEAVWPRICSADYSEVEAGLPTSRRLGRFRDFDHMSTNSRKQAQ